MLHWWGLDTVWLLCVFGGSICVASLVVARDLVGHFVAFSRVRARLHALVQSSTASLHLNKVMTLLYWLAVLMALLSCLVYNYAYLLGLALSKLISYSLHWLFCGLVLLLGAAVVYVFSVRARVAYWTHELVISLVLLLVVLPFYMVVNGLFLVILVLEAQGATLFYFLSGSQEVGRHPALRAGNLGGGRPVARQGYLWVFGAIFTQFWAAFVGAMLLLYSSIRLGYYFGSVDWQDLRVLHELSQSVDLPYVEGGALLAFNLLLLGLFLKAGLFPQHFWKPELYRNISWEAMLWYASVYTFAVLYLLVVVLNVYLGTWCYHHVLWVAAAGSVVLLANVLFVISELKVFIAYMSVFHSTYILMGALGSAHGAFASSLAYLVMYMALVLHFMGVVLVLRGRNLQFLTDLQGLSALPGLSAGFICVFAAMSGIPPLLGFWAKISIISALLAHSEVALAVLALAGGLLLMYFYLQNYRFNVGITKSFGGASLVVVDALGGLFCIVALGVLLNVGALFLVNDLWNFCTFFVETTALELW